MITKALSQSSIVKSYFLVVFISLVIPFIFFDQLSLMMIFKWQLIALGGYLVLGGLIWRSFKMAENKISLISHEHKEFRSLIDSSFLMAQINQQGEVYESNALFDQYQGGVELFDWNQARQTLLSGRKWSSSVEFNDDGLIGQKLENSIVPVLNNYGDIDHFTFFGQVKAEKEELMTELRMRERTLFDVNRL